jgi:hypothetical protein
VANTNAPVGLQVIRARGAYSFSDQGNLYSIPSTDGNAFYLNDVVKAAASSDAQGVPNVTKITNGTDLIRGVLQIILPVYAKPSLVGTALSLETTNIPATKAAAYYVVINDDYTTTYLCQDDGITTASLVAASANLNSSLTITAGASTTSPSATVLLSSSFAATLGLCIKLNGLVQQSGNVYGAFAKWQCYINTSEMPATGATGV